MLQCKYSARFGEHGGRQRRSWFARAPPRVRWLRAGARVQDPTAPLLLLAGEPYKRKEVRRRRHAALRPHDILLYVLRHRAADKVSLVHPVMFSV